MLIDRYVIGKFVGRLVGAIIAATVIFLVVDLVENLDKFIDSRVGTLTILRFYYLYVPYIVYLVLPVATLLATLFTMGGMAMSNELAAMHASGVPFGRILAMLMLVAAATAAAGFMLGESVVPLSNRERMDIDRYEVKKLPRESRARFGKLYLQIDSKRQAYIDHYKPATKEAYDVVIIHSDRGRIHRRVDAEKMVWRDKKWLLQGTVERRFSPSGAVDWQRDVEGSISGAGLQPSEIERIQTKPEEMNWDELKEFIARIKNAGGSSRRWEVDLFSKVALPAAAVIIVLFGAPIAAVKRRGGAALVFALCLFVCFLYFGLIQVGKVLGINGILSPFLSAWMGNIIFGALGLGLLLRRV